MLPGRGTVTLTPIGESPFVFRDSRLDFFPKQTVIESRADGKPGLFLIKESQVSDESYCEALRDLDGAKVGAIVRRTGQYTIECWNIDGQPISLEEAGIKGHVLSRLGFCELAIRVIQPAKDVRDSKPDCVFGIPLLNELTSGGTYESWTTVAVPQVSYVDVLMQVSGQFHLNGYIGRVPTLPVVAK